MSAQHDFVEPTDGSRKTLSGYVTGLVLSLLLTLMSFGLIEKRIFSDKYTYIFLSVLAILQLFAQAIFFLRLNSSRQGQWNLLPFIFTVLIIAILVAGTLWIMYNLNYYMTN